MVDFVYPGAINDVLDPIKQSFPIIVLFLFLPSKLHVIEPAPIFVLLQ